MELFKKTTNIRDRDFRPCGDITSLGNYEYMLNDAKNMANILSEEKGVIGITLCGGLSRGYADALSEIDLIIYLEDEVYNEWIIGLGPVPHGDILWEGKYYDIEFYSYQKELKENWNLTKRWDASYNVILYDPDEKVANILKKKDYFTSQEKFKIASIAWEKCMYLGDIVIQQWRKRGDPFAANHLINKAISGLIDLVFLANDEYIPYEKWAINYTYSLKWLPKDWKKRIEQILLISKISLKEAERRQEILIDLYNECWEKIVGKNLKDLEPIDIATLNEIQFIIDNSPVPLEEFSNRFKLDHLSFEPHFKLTNIVKKDRKKFIAFNKKNYIKHKKADFSDFLIWNKRSLRKLKIN